MTSPSKPKSMQQIVNESLDTANERLTASQNLDIARVRRAALQGETPEVRRGWLQPTMRYALPTVAVVAFSVLVSQRTTEQVPILPAALVGASMPGEDLALLEDLEFVSWLAENEQETVL